MACRNRVRMLNVANRRLRRAKYFLIRERKERTVDEIETTIAIIGEVLKSLNKKNSYPRKCRGKGKYE
ncbi:hypothetical protein YDYSY3_41610 [Paenibacillus chitinolyticus]|nr:hypothetical protein YDYSY3_41610 [Paenibacillus chitinolyticus]